MAGLVTFWSLAAFVAFVTLLAWRSSPGNLLSATRRRVFAAVLGAAMAALSLLAGVVPRDAQVARGVETLAPTMDVRAQVLALLGGVVFAVAVNAQLARLARPEADAVAAGKARAARGRRWTGGTVISSLVALAVIAPLAVLVAPTPSDGEREAPVLIAPSMWDVLARAVASGCGVSASLPGTHAYRVCASTAALHMERQWVLVTKLEVPEAAPAYLVRVCAHEDESWELLGCTYSLEREPPADDAVDLRPYASGVRVLPEEQLGVSFESRRGLWTIERRGARASTDLAARQVYDARTLGAELPARGLRIIPRLEPRFELVPTRWAIPLGAWAAFALGALRAWRLARRRQARLAEARAGEMHDGLLHVEGEPTPRQLVGDVQARTDGAHVQGPVVWTPRGERTVDGYRGYPLALAAEVTPGDLDTHRQSARGAVLRAFALCASAVGCGALPVLVAGLGHLVDPGVPLNFREPQSKVFVDASQTCRPGQVLVDGSHREGSTPRALLDQRLPPTFCVDARPVLGLATTDAAAYCRLRGEAVATPAEVLAAVHERRANPAVFGSCIDDCSLDDVEEAMSTESCRCAGAAQAFAVDERP
jgi:hypothetical protein